MSIQHVVRLDVGWAVRGDHEPAYREAFHNEADAVRYAWLAAGVGGQIVVHEPDGTTEVFVR